MKHINIPLFIQHMGCPNQCVFCDQRAITGAPSFSLGAVRMEIENVLKTCGNAECEIAFFGGSFTGIDRALMTALLDIAEEYVSCGAVSGIRMSTRPDYISDEICDILSNYTISQIELGIQSMSDRVLTASRRGHTKKASIYACELLKKRGFSFVGQMMTGLPEATANDEIETAEMICRMGADAARIYPLIVFCNTPLADMTRGGEYTPLTVDEAVQRCADAYEVFLRNNIPCLKIGLHESENLHDPKCALAGPIHPAMGELVRGEIYFRRIMSCLSTICDLKDKDIIINVPKGAVSMACGHKGINKARILAQTAVKNVKIIENDELLLYNISITVL